MLEIVSSILKDYNKEYPINRNDEFPIRTSLLHQFIEQRGVVDRIKIFETNVKTEIIVAEVQKFRGQQSVYSGILDVAHIYYAASYNICWRRFGVCKEMYHCMIDRSDADRVATIDTLKTLLELLATDTTAVSGDFAPLSREHQAELLALETLFPVEFRQKYLDNPIHEDADYIKIATEFRIPVEYAKIACQPNYVRMCTQRRGRLLETLGEK